MLIDGILACCNNKGIGKDNKLPWHLKEDLKRFQMLTTGSGNNCVIMGRKTWDSINFLKNRDHLILSQNIKLDYKQENNIVKTFKNIDSLMKFIKESNYDKAWVIGGEKVMSNFINLNILNNLYLTYIDESYECDTYIPIIPDHFFVKSREKLEMLTEYGNKVFLFIYTRVEENMYVFHNNEKWKIEKIHYDDYPIIYFTIKNREGREKQTIRNKLTLIT